MFEIIIPLLAPGVEIVALQMGNSLFCGGPTSQGSEIIRQHVVDGRPVWLETRVRAPTSQRILPFCPGGLGFGNLADEAVEHLAGGGICVHSNDDVLLQRNFPAAILLLFRVLQ